MGMRLAAPAVLIACAVGAAAGYAVWWCAGIGIAAWLVCLRGAGRRSALTVLVVAAVLRGAFLSSDFTSNDLARYLWEGHVQLAGQSPYALAPNDPALASLRDERYARIFAPELPTVYPPAAQALFLSAAAAGLDERGLRNVVLGLDLAVVALLLGWLRATGRRPGWALAYAWSPLALASAAAGHVDPLMLLAGVGFAFAWEQRRVRTAAALLGLAILAKTVAVALLPWLLLRRWRAVLTVTLPVVALGYAPYLGAGNVAGSLTTFGTEFAFNASLFRGLEALSSTAAPWLSLTLFAVWCAWIAFSQRRPAPAWALAMAGLLLLAPTVHYWYLTWFLVVLPAVAPRWWRSALLVWSASVIAAAPSYLGFIRGETPRAEPLLHGLEYALPALVLLVQGWRQRPRRALLADGGAPPPGRVAVIVPCYGEAENLRALLPRWRATRVDRVIVADVPSGDGSDALCRGDDRIHYLPTRRGYGSGVAAGLAVAAAGGADLAVVCDADHHRGPEQLEHLLAPFADERVGLVCAARLGVSHLTRLQRFGNALTTGLIALGWGHWFRDLGPFRAIRLAALPALGLRDRHFGWNVEMNVRVLECGWEVVEVDLPPDPRPHGRNRITGSLASSLRAGIAMLWRLHRLRVG